MKKIINAFSYNMIDESLRSEVFGTINTPITQKEFDSIKGEYKSYVGHEQLAEILNVPFSKKHISLSLDDDILLIQYIGKRFEDEGMREGSLIRFYKVKIFLDGNQ